MYVMDSFRRAREKSIECHKVKDYVMQPDDWEIFILATTECGLSILAKEGLFEPKEPKCSDCW